MNIFGLELGRQRQSGTGADAPLPAAAPAAGLVSPVSTLEPRMGAAPTLIGAVGQAKPAMGTTTAAPRIGSLRSPATQQTTPAASQAAPTGTQAGQTGLAALESRVAGIESLMSAIAGKLGVTASAEGGDPGDEDETDPEGAMEGGTGEDEENETAEPVMRTPSQVRAACAGASAQFVEGVLEAGLTATQAKKLFATQSSAAPQRRNRLPVGGQPGGAQAAGSAVHRMEQTIQARAEAIRVEKNVTSAVALGLAMQEAKRLDPSTFFDYKRIQHQRHQRSVIGAAAESN